MNNVEIFNDVKARLSIIDVARYYGYEVNGGNFINCPSHDEKTPSMKLYEKNNANDNFHCFGCGAHGDIIDLISITFNLDPVQAANKIAGDFGITASGRKTKPSITKRIKQHNSQEQENRAYKLIAAYCDYLKQCRRDYAPKTHTEELHPLFCKSLNEYSTFNYYKEILTFGTKNEREAFVRDSGAVLAGIEKALKETQTRQNNGRDISDDR